MGDVSYLVYNCEDVVNPPPNLELEKTKSLLEERRKNLGAVNPDAEALIAAFAKITPIYHDSTNGSNFYTPGRNEIHVAPREQFSSNDAYYSTIFHEMAHATGKVFGRNMTGMFGSKSYAEEEFNAEWSAIQMCANTGVLYDLQNHTSYIHGWGGALFDLKTKPTAKEDPEVLFNQWEEMANSEDGKKVFQRVFDNSAKVMELMNSVTKENFDIEKFKKRIEHNKEDIAIER